MKVKILVANILFKLTRFLVDSNRTLVISTRIPWFVRTTLKIGSIQSNVFPVCITISQRIRDCSWEKIDEWRKHPASEFKSRYNTIFILIFVFFISKPRTWSRRGVGFVLEFLEGFATARVADQWITELACVHLSSAHNRDEIIKASEIGYARNLPDIQWPDCILLMLNQGALIQILCITYNYIWSRTRRHIFLVRL